MKFLTLLPLAAVAVARPMWEFDPAKWAFDTAETIIGDSNEVEVTHHHTIWKQLQDEDKYSKLVKILKFEEDTIKELDKKDDKITFFAVNNDGLHHPHHGHHGHHGHEDDFDTADLPEDLMTLGDVWNYLEASPWLLDPVSEDDDKDKKPKKPDDDKKKKWRKIIKKIIHAVLQYHILPDAHSHSSLAQNHTLATKLHPHDGSADGQARRIRVERGLIPPGSVRVNFYATVRSSSDASNGVLHELDHPLFPPASIFEEAFVASRWVSTTTSAIQRVHGRHYIDYAYDHHESKPGKPKFWGAPLATFFAPSNDAWNLLPPRLHVYLFSKFGQRALGKLLAYHYVPHTLVHIEHVHHEKHKKKDDETAAFDGGEFHHEFEVHSGIPKEKLKIVLDKKKIGPIDSVFTSISVNGIHSHVNDIPARNGAWHVLGRVLCPPHHHHEDVAEDHPDGEWAGWETWLPAWAEEE